MPEMRRCALSLRAEEDYGAGRITSLLRKPEFIMINSNTVVLLSAAAMKCCLTRSFTCCCRFKDELWRTKCEEDWGETRLVSPSSRGSETVPTYLQTWQVWCTAFKGYDGAFRTHLLECLRSHAVEI